MDILKTRTGLDATVDIILNDKGLPRRASAEDIVAGAKAAATMNAMIIEGVRVNGLLDDGDLTSSDVTAISDWIRADAKRSAQFAAAHGEDTATTETGFHRVRGDWGSTFLFGARAIDCVLDGIYHIGFKAAPFRFTSETGALDVGVGVATSWLNKLLANDIAKGTLVSGAAPSFERTGTGLDRLVDIVLADPGLQTRISEFDIRGGAAAAAGLNKMLVQGIRENGLADDGDITGSDLRAISEWVRADARRYASFVEMHGDDDGEVETGFHLVQNDGAKTALFGTSAVNVVADGLYHFGFEIGPYNFQNEDGDTNIGVHRGVQFINGLMQDDLKKGALVSGKAPTFEKTGTGLDKLVDVVMNDVGLQYRISEFDIRAGAKAAASLNAMIVQGVRATGVAKDGAIQTADVYALSDWFRADKARLDRFVFLHGDDENNVETGFHLVQGDGAKSNLFGRNAVDAVMDGLYHIGFEIKNYRFVNEDGDPNVGANVVADWLDKLFADDFGTAVFA